ncbi:heat-shock protein Hsp20 [Elstera litoralis]|uniref:Heat-shock protein Hsp20 n=1 Tax=Elstera litoralis TaxID=552518 RepID=A0A0F3IUL2_9PROT|nr:Hsp20 family protein [Elstera litoralis]KJV10435.1 heat-shock protein Hsp20 [Elstera litoralis]
MTRVSVLNSPFLLGFEHVERTLDRIAKGANEGYPPYNIEQTGQDRLRITLAVAGFRREDMSIQIENNQLVIRGRQQDDSDRVFLHRGIAARQFQRTFVLVEGIEVIGAEIDNGLLNIDLHRPLPEVTVRTVEIKTPPKAKPKTPTLDVAPEAPAGISE